MEAIQGAGGADSRAGLWDYAVKAAHKTSARVSQGQRENTPCIGAALSLSRDYLRFALQDSGFVDICAGHLTVSDEDGLPGGAIGTGVQIEMDVQMAAEVAAYFGQQVASSSIDQILEIVSRPDPKYALKLLK